MKKRIMAGWLAWMMVFAANAGAVSIFEDHFTNNIIADSDAETAYWTAAVVGTGTVVEKGGAVTLTGSDSTGKGASAAISSAVDKRFDFFTPEGLTFSAKVALGGKIASGDKERAWYRFVIGNVAGGKINQANTITFCQTAGGAYFLLVTDDTGVRTTLVKGAGKAKVSAVSLHLDEKNYLLEITFDDGNTVRRAGSHKLEASFWGSGSAVTFKAGKDSGKEQVSADTAPVMNVSGFAVTSETGNRPLILPPPVSDVDRFPFIAPDSGKGYAIVVKQFVDEVEPTKAPDFKAKFFDVLSAQGEWQALDFVIYANAELKNVQIEAAPLRGANGSVIPADCVEIRLNRRVLQKVRKGSDDCLNRAALLDPYRPFDLPAGYFKEVTIVVKTPAGQLPGRYKGAILVRSADRDGISIPVRYEIVPLRLEPSVRKQYGMYYMMNVTAQTRQEEIASLKDMTEHGITCIFGGFGIEYAKQNGSFIPDYGKLRRGLNEFRDAGFTGTVIVGTGLDKLDVKLAGGALAIAPTEQWPAEKLAELRRIAAEALKGLQDIRKEYPDLHIIITHMDEVFGRNRFDRYVRLTQAVREVAPDEKIYITLHNMRDNVRPFLDAVDPYVDIRSYTGYAMEIGYQSGVFDFPGLAEEIGKSGDKAWFYQNPNHPYYTAEWSRIVNGLYMWIIPMEVHIPFRYRTMRSPPFDFSHNMGYTVASPEDGVTPVPLRNWLGMRLGMQDCWHLCMLEDLIHKASPDSPPARAAQAWLEKVRALLPKPEELPAPTYGEGYGSSSPLLTKFAARLDGNDIEQIRRRTIKHILALQKPGITMGN